MDAAFVQLGTQALTVRAMEFAFNRGIAPSVATLYIVPQDNFDPSSTPCDLTFGSGSGQMTFHNCAVASCNHRYHWDSKWPLWAVQVMDRRWKWRLSGSITGEYNKRIPNSATLLSARDLMTLCLTAMGESGYDVSGAPTGVYPYVNWKNANPALALAELCDYCACEVVLNPLTDRVEIWQLGVGQQSPTGLTDLIPKYRFVPRAYVPSVVEVHSGDSLFQYRLLLEAVGRGSNLVQSANPDWIKSGVSVLIESFNWPSVTDTLGSELALATGWRQYRVRGQEGGGLNVPGVSVAIGNTNQYKLRDYILYNTYDDRTGQYQLLPYYVEGDFWPYSDLPNNVTNQVYLGASTLYKERNLVEFHYPFIKLDSSGYPTTPTLYLQVAYSVVDQQGTPVHLVRSDYVGGSAGTLVLRRPEIFAGYTATYNGEAAALAELNAYVSLFKQKYSQPNASEMTYGGIIPGTLDGNIAQATWSIHPTRGPTTRVCEAEELNTAAVGSRERRRREQLRKLLEAA